MTLNGIVLSASIYEVARILKKETKVMQYLKR